MVNAGKANEKCAKTTNYRDCELENEVKRNV